MLQRAWPALSPFAVLRGCEALGCRALASAFAAIAKVQAHGIGEVYKATLAGKRPVGSAVLGEYLPAKRVLTIPGNHARDTHAATAIASRPLALGCFADVVAPGRPVRDFVD